MSFKVCVVLLSVILAADAQNWCTVSVCAPNAHIACNNNGAFASTCVAPQVVTFTAAQQQLIVNGHNTNRNMIASGNLVGFLPARRMARMTWNAQIAQFAALNTRQCRMAHDTCRNTPTFVRSGQNLAIMSTTGTFTTEEVINRSLRMWFDEYRDATMTNINRVGTSARGVIGHFTAMVTDRSTAVGCGLSQFRTTSGSNTFNTYLFACNYASTNIINCPVYVSGNRASGCTGGADPTFPGLCRTTENIDPNSTC